MTFFIFLLACAAAASTGVIFKPGAWYAALVSPASPRPTGRSAGLDAHLPAAGLGRLSLEPDPRQPNGAGAVGRANRLEHAVDPVFFGAHQLLAGMVIIVLLWITVAAMVALAVRLDLITGLILFPYLAWLCVAAALNFSIWRNNR
jgi:tryptophan-rich sensory protein